MPAHTTPKLEPRPCPFCAAPGIWHQYAKVPHSLRFRMRCSTCGAAGPAGNEDGKDAATLRWNTRPKSPEDEE